MYYSQYKEILITAIKKVCANVGQIAPMFAHLTGVFEYRHTKSIAPCALRWKINQYLAHFSIPFPATIGKTETFKI